MAGLHEPEHDIAGLAAIGAHGAARNPALGDAGPRVVFGGIGVERDLGPLQHLQQFALSPVQGRQQLTQLLVTGALPEDVVEALGEDGRLLCGRLLLPELQIAVEAPDLVSDLFQLAGLLGCLRHQLLQQPLGMMVWMNPPSKPGSLLGGNQHHRLTIILSGTPR